MIVTGHAVRQPDKSLTLVANIPTVSSAVLNASDSTYHADPLRHVLQYMFIYEYRIKSVNFKSSIAVPVSNGYLNIKFLTLNEVGIPGTDYDSK